MTCKKCDGDFVVGEGGRLECSRCGYIAGDISLLFGEKPFEGTSQYQQFDPQVIEGYVGEPHSDIRKPA